MLLALLRLLHSLTDRGFLCVLIASGVLVLRLCWWCWWICELVEVVLCLFPWTHFGCFSWEGGRIRGAVFKLGCMRLCSGRAIPFRERVIRFVVCVELEAVPVCGLVVDLVYPA
ncbi:hypothetical protein M758_9G160700 [Ceratodon purpureus]|nr:hypothetical protein M758_9G160700 [Ceratodon purpureus]